MSHDVAQTGLGFELALLRALGEGRRRRSLADRLLRERRAAKTFPEVSVEQMSPRARPSSRSSSEP